jgi:hypothetical protein
MNCKITRVLLGMSGLEDGAARTVEESSPWNRPKHGRMSHADTSPTNRW